MRRFGVKTGIAGKESSQMSRNILLKIGELEEAGC